MEKLGVYEAKLKQIRDSYKANGQELDDECRITKGGAVIREVRKLTKEEIEHKNNEISNLFSICRLIYKNDYFKLRNTIAFPKYRKLF